MMQFLNKVRGDFKMARPTKMTAATVKKLYQAFAFGLSDAESALYAGVSKQTIYNYQKDHPEFLDRKEELKETVKMHAKINIARRVTKKKDIGVSIWFLEHKDPDYTNKSDITHHGEIQTDNPLAGLTTDELRRVINDDHGGQESTDSGGEQGTSET